MYPLGPTKAQQFECVCANTNNLNLCTSADSHRYMCTLLDRPGEISAPGGAINAMVASVVQIVHCAN